MKKFLATDATFNFPSGIFVTPNDEVFIGDYENHRVRKILCDGTIVTIAGNGENDYSGDGGPATDAELRTPTSVFVSSHNEVYIVEYDDSRIRKIKTDGTITTIAGNGQEGFSGDGGLAINAKISFIENIYVSENDEVYLADCNNNRIRKILKNGNIITIAGNGKQEYGGDGVIATETGLNEPFGVFVSQNGEIYISDTENNCIRKILKNGTIITIAGTGKRGFSGDEGLAINAKLNFPTSLFVSSNDEVYFVDRDNYRIRKILKNGNIETIVGNGTRGFSGDNGLAINAQISVVHSLYISENDELYIVDNGNNRIRKVLRNGTIITIAGNGKCGYSGDSPFDFSLNPHIRYPANNISNDMKLKKHSRDEFGFELIGFIPLIEKLSPQFCQIILKNEKFLKSMNTEQLKIIQKLIDWLIYDIKQLIYGKDEELDLFFILGLFKNGEFFDFKRSWISEFVNSITLKEFPSKWEKIESLLQSCQELGVHNYILEYLSSFCFEFAAVNMKTTEGCSVLSTLPIVIRNAGAIFSKMATAQPSAIVFDEKIEVEPESLETLFNDKKTSDVYIKMGKERYLYCHKTVLSSSSTLFAAMFQSGSSFSDLSDGIFTPDESEDLELLEIIIKYCYGILVGKVATEKIIGLLDMAMKHEIEYLVNYCKRYFSLSIDNYFSIVSACVHYLDLPLFEGFLQEIIRFGIDNKKQLFNDKNAVAKLPEKVLQILVWNWANDC